MKRTEPSADAARRAAPIGAGHRPAWFARRHSDGRYEQLLGPMRPTDHAVQRALIGETPEQKRQRRHGLLFVVAVAALGVAGFVVSI